MSGLSRTVPPASRTVPFVRASVRGPGAVRYRCPESGSYVLLTDGEALRRMSTRPVFCAGCGGEHRLIRAEAEEVPVETAA
jgi:hypothetical protein